MIDLTGRVILVTGAGRGGGRGSESVGGIVGGIVGGGIGSGIVRRFAAAGATVATPPPITCAIPTAHRSPPCAPI